VERGIISRDVVDRIRSAVVRDSEDSSVQGGASGSGSDVPEAIPERITDTDNRPVTKEVLEESNPGSTVEQGGGNFSETANRVDANIQENTQACESSGFSESTVVQDSAAPEAIVPFPTPRTVGSFQGGPLEGAVQISGRFNTNNGPSNGTVYRADNQGNVASYATYDSHGNISSRVDIDPNSAPHFDKVTGVTMNPPHVVDYPKNVLPDGSVRTQTNAGVMCVANPEGIP